MDTAMFWQSLSRSERAKLCIWLIGVSVVSFVATHAIVSKAVALKRRTPDGSFSRHFVVWWASLSVGSFVLLALIGGVVVFHAQRRWLVALAWGVAAGAALGLGYLIAMAGQMDAGAPLCDAPPGGECDTAFGMGGLVLSAIAAVPLATAFATGFALRRALVRFVPTGRLRVSRRRT